VSFTLLSFPVRVEWSFFIMSAILGWRSGDIPMLILWVAVSFVSVMAHELGHAFAARAYGYSASITLYSMGGLTHIHALDTTRRGQQIMISFAGPFFGLLLGGLIYSLKPSLGSVHSPYIRSIVQVSLWINIGWSLVNLLPVLPLDGGHIMESLVRKPKQAEWISLVVAVYVALLAYRVGFFFATILFAWLGFNSYQAIRMRHP
jgi:Zn-dependent protease